MVIWYNNIL